ncbi:NAC domain-containing protein 8 [Acorus calamus]|uniref:NAC domain-containing protein 8 n=1 Tax=Acorus calamus TaxID=4465 RepID=A0AAV9CIK1_ACOCL|nr:NAC domain-containing protein 8 [Acorus calamus]
MGKSVPRLSDYARMGAEVLKKDLDECQNLNHIDHLPLLDTPPDFHLSQLEFGSQDSFLAWGGTKVAG